jgi:iron complex outermembrane receptor protein
VRPSVLCAGLSAAALAGGGAFAQVRSAEPTPLGQVVVVAPSALPGAGIDSDKLPGVVAAVSARDFERSGSLAVTDALEQQVPGLSLSDTQGSGFAKDVDYRGFKASPLDGAPEGLAVYMGAVRLNEAFGDTVNWDLIPQTAIADAQVFSSAPAFGLNALGGAISLQMKTGFDAAGGKADAEAGSFGKAYGSAEYGVRDGAWGLYLAAEGGREAGWREHSPARLARAYADLGWRGEGAELHMALSAGGDDLGGVGPTPADLLSRDRRAVYTSPQTTRNDAALTSLSGKFTAPAGWSIQAGLYARRFDQRHLDGNDGDFEGCSGNRANPLYGTLCAQDDAFPSALRPPAAAFQVLGPGGAPIGCPPLIAGQSKPCNGIAYGSLDRTRTGTSTGGVSLQADRSAPILGRANRFLAGASLDRSWTRFAADSALGVIFPDLQVGPQSGVPGSGQPIHTAGSVAYSPVDVSARVADYGLYASDTLDVTRALSVTVSGRFNSVRLGMTDLTGASSDLTGNHRYDRFNPALGMTYRLLPAVTLYGGYSESNRAPTALELGCSNPLKPCLIESALVSDPPLEQVVARSWEAGARGRWQAGSGRVDWSAGLFQTASEDDIVALASQLLGRGSYANVPQTRRRGVEAGLRYKAAGWSAHAGYSHVEATYAFAGALASPNSPYADQSGNIQVRPGDRIGGIPADRLKAGADLAPTPALDLGVDMVATGGQFLAGDESNQDRPLPGYWTMAVRASYRLGRVELFGRIDNLLDRRYATYGAYFDPTGVANVSPSPLPAGADPRMSTPAPPRSFLAGMRLTW